MKTTLPIVTILLSIGFLVGCNQTNKKPIDGLFGLKLGEPLPPSCTNSESFFGEPVEGGFQMVVFIIPPQTNFMFSRYSVTLTPTNRLVCYIGATSSDDFSKHFLQGQLFTEIQKTLHERYGNKDVLKRKIVNKDGAYLDTDSWSDGSRNLVLRYSSSDGSVSLDCNDDSVFPNPAIDKNGL